MKNLPLLPLLVGSVSLLLVGQYLFCHGMFLDGIIYSTLARNHALSANHCWDFWMKEGDLFFSHPPLALWLQALLFKLFGDYFWVDRLYSILCLLGSLYFIHKLWQEIAPNSPSGAAWVQLLYISLPLVHWSFANNILENTCTCFLLGSTWLYFKGFNKQHYIYYILAGIAVFCATLSKGPVGLFPLIIPFLLHQDSQYKSSFYASITALLSLLTCWALLLWSSTEAMHYFNQYWHLQLVGSLQGNYGESNHFLVLKKLLSQGSLLIILGLFLRLFCTSLPLAFPSSKQAWRFLCLGLAGSLPLMISPKQMNFYIVPALVFFVFSFVLFHINYLLSIEQWLKKQKLIRYFSILSMVLLLGITIASYGRIVRDKIILHDVFIAGTIVDAHSQAECSEALQNDWVLQAYLMRYFHIAAPLAPQNPILYISLKKETAPPKYQLLPTQSIRYNFHKK